MQLITVKRQMMVIASHPAPVLDMGPFIIRHFKGIRTVFNAGPARNAFFPLRDNR